MTDATDTDGVYETLVVYYEPDSQVVAFPLKRGTFDECNEYLSALSVEIMNYNNKRINFMLFRSQIEPMPELMIAARHVHSVQVMKVNPDAGKIAEPSEKAPEPPPNDPRYIDPALAMPSTGNIGSGPPTLNMFFPGHGPSLDVPTKFLDPADVPPPKVSTNLNPLDYEG
jgi:hypothetical protein